MHQLFLLLPIRAIMVKTIAKDCRAMRKPTGKPVGRPSDCVPEKTIPILASIAKRIPYELAAEANGIDEGTFYNWMKRGKRDIKNKTESAEAEFFKAVRKTEENKITEHLDCINSMPERWQAQTWILSKRWHQYFSENTAIVKLHEELQAMRNDMEARNNEETK